MIKDCLVRHRRPNRAAKTALRRGVDLSSVSRRESGTHLRRHTKVVIGFVVEDNVGRRRARFVADPSLNDIEPFRGLVDIVKIGDILERIEQLDQTIGTAADETDCQSSSILSDLVKTRSQTDFTVHPRPRKFPARQLLRLERAYANGGSIRTTNMGFREDLHKIFEMPII